MASVLTRRGQAVLGTVVLGAVLGYGFGGRTLNAVVVPGVALLAVTWVYVRSYPDPELGRVTPHEGSQGEQRTVELRVIATRSYPVTVRDRLDDGLRGDTELATVADGRWVEYEVEFASRGVHSIGPVRVEATDPFGLWATAWVIRDKRRATVFPRVHSLAGTATLLTGYVGLTDEREQFAGVREYERGDPLRDVNWKASAKRPSDLAITEFVGEGTTNSVTVAVEALGPREDSVAEAAASVATHLLDAGVAVGIATPTGTLDPAHGDPHRRRILELLARFDRGKLRSRHRENAEIVVQAPASGEHVSVTVGDSAHRYGEFVGGQAGVGQADRRGASGRGNDSVTGQEVGT